MESLTLALITFQVVVVRSNLVLVSKLSDATRMSPKHPCNILLCNLPLLANNARLWIQF